MYQELNANVFSICFFIQKQLERLFVYYTHQYFISYVIMYDEVLN